MKTLHGRNEQKHIFIVTCAETEFVYMHSPAHIADITDLE